MPIIKFPENQSPPATLACAICHKQVSPAEATAGLYNLGGSLAFACNGHFWNGGQFIVGWADFAISKRLRRLTEYGGARDVWAVR